MALEHLGALLLDMDGTLVDSDASVERAWIAWASRYDVEPARALLIAHGNHADTTVRALRPDLDETAVAEAAAFQLAMQYKDLADVVPAVGAHRLLDVVNRRGLPGPSSPAPTTRWQLFGSGRRTSPPRCSSRSRT